MPEGAGHIKGFGGAGKRAKPWNSVANWLDLTRSVAICANLRYFRVCMCMRHNGIGFAI